MGSLPPSTIEDIMVSLANKKIFTKLDLVRAFHYIPIADQDIPKTAIITPFGLYEFLAMFFGLRNASFQRFMDKILKELDFSWCYIDDRIK